MNDDAVFRTHLLVAGVVGFMVVLVIVVVVVVAFSSFGLSSSDSELLLEWWLKICSFCAPYKSRFGGELLLQLELRSSSSSSPESDSVSEHLF